MGQLIAMSQARGVLQFKMPDLGFLWSYVSQDTTDYMGNFVKTSENYAGVNMSENAFMETAASITPSINGSLDLGLSELPTPEDPFR